MSSSNELVPAGGENQVVPASNAISPAEAAPLAAPVTPWDQLSQKQKRALHDMAHGIPLRSAARNAGVNRSTVYRWMRSDPVFRAAYNNWEQDVRISWRTRLLQGVSDAVDTLVSEVTGDGWLALALLRETKVLGPMTPGGSQVEQVRKEMAAEQSEEDRRIDRRLRRATGKRARKPGRAMRIMLMRSLLETVAGEVDPDADATLRATAGKVSHDPAATQNATTS